jgi:hypothetical protein
MRSLLYLTGRTPSPFPAEPEQLLHVDETKVRLRNKDGYVWVFADMGHVVYIYSDTREGDILQTMLKDFRGVLVSDFYAAYDAVQCPQQKCLIHLIRDLNDDLLKHPYDAELKVLVLGFGSLLQTDDRKSRSIRLESPFSEEASSSCEAILSPNFQKQATE